SSRRRHTRSKRDWSSDVCSSDLAPHGNVIGHDGERRLPVLQKFADQEGERAFRGFEFVALMLQFFDAGENRLQLRRVVGDFETRSEERRVGKECRSRWWA